MQLIFLPLPTLTERYFKMKLLNKVIITVASVTVLATGFYYYQTAYQAKPEDLYRLDKITTGNIEQSVSANGTLNPVTVVSVGTQVSGIVRKLYVDFNDEVKKDQILLELDSSLFMAQINQSQGAVRNVQASVDLAQANEARIRSLYTQDYVSKQELDTAVQVLKSAKAQLDTARGQLARDKTNLGFSIIRSPVSGVVVDRIVDIGQTVAASFQTPELIKIAQDLSKMQIDSSFAEADIGNIKVGQIAKFSVDAYPNRNFDGLVKQVRLNPTNTSNVVTYNVVISVDNKDQVLLPGMTAYVNIGVAKHDQVLLVPNAALRFKPKVEENSESQTIQSNAKKRPKKASDSSSDDLSTGKIYLLKNGKPSLVKVRVGISDGRNTEITSITNGTAQLKAGDTIIVSEIDGAAQAKTGRNTRGPRMF